MVCLIRVVCLSVIRMISHQGGLCVIRVVSVSSGWSVIKVLFDQGFHCISFCSWSRRTLCHYLHKASHQFYSMQQVCLAHAANSLWYKFCHCYLWKRSPEILSSESLDKPKMAAINEFSSLSFFDSRKGCVSDLSALNLKRSRTGLFHFQSCICLGL